MRMNLGGVLGTSGGQTERGYGPIQVTLPVGPPQWKSFTHGRLVDLYYSDTCLLKVTNFVADCQRDLSAGFCARLIVSDQRPPQDCDWPGEHSFHRLLGQRLRKAGTLNGHRPEAGDIS